MSMMKKKDKGLTFHESHLYSSSAFYRCIAYLRKIGVTEEIMVKKPDGTGMVKFYCLTLKGVVLGMILNSFDDKKQKVEMIRGVF